MGPTPSRLEPATQWHELANSFDGLSCVRRGTVELATFVEARRKEKRQTQRVIIGPSIERNGITVTAIYRKNAGTDHADSSRRVSRIFWQ